MKIPTMLLWRVLLDVRLQSSDTIERDYKEICSRYQKEGMSFLTITLPRLDDALLKGLARGRLTHADYVGFRSRNKRGSLPALLQGFFRRIFDNDGLLLATPDVSAIFAIRQVTRLFKKVELPCTDERVTAAFERYEANDRQVDWSMHRKPINISLWTSVCGYLWSDLEALSGELYCFPGDFGSGATAERVPRNARRTVRLWPARSERSFPLDFHAVSRPDSDDLSDVEILEPGREQPVRVVQVPKTLKTPRTISVEPSYMMLMQQSVAKPLMSWLESRWGFNSIRFSDQSVNRELARLGSTDGALATIDLSDASDLVSNDLVCDIFRGVAPTFLDMIQDCRTRTARMPSGTILQLRKFASMGSALCFPVEAMVFFTIVIYAILQEKGMRPSRTLIEEISKSVAVYGDDIIVPASMAPVVMKQLEVFGLRVNHDKSFCTGLFRESCGGDYYSGVDVTPAYVRQWDFTGTLSRASHLVAYVALSNILYMKGMWHASQYIRDHVDGLNRARRRKRLPISRYPIGCLHYCSFFRSDSLVYDQRHHSYGVRGRSPKSTLVSDSPSNMSGFLRLSLSSSFIKTAREEFSIGPRSVYPPANPWRTDLTISRPKEKTAGRRSNGHLPKLDESLVQGSSVSELFPSWGVPYSELRVQCIAQAAREWIRGTSFRTGPIDPMYTSERPYSLCLKSKWTASPAGLEW
nr:MAG: hypothetical protein 3 [Leviviridae sp.]